MDNEGITVPLFDVEVDLTKKFTPAKPPKPKKSPKSKKSKGTGSMSPNKKPSTFGGPEFMRLKEGRNKIRMLGQPFSYQGTFRRPDGKLVTAKRFVMNVIDWNDGHFKLMTFGKNLFRKINECVAGGGLNSWWAKAHDYIITKEMSVQGLHRVDFYVRPTGTWKHLTPTEKSIVKKKLKSVDELKEILETPNVR